ncbi:MAG TPA: ATP-binding protein, partial [Minicystis sp.]|nr:ATP-binding protein [Minicystis sp.]
LEALGRLAAGVAHEINTPLQFIMNSVQFIDDALPELLGPAADADAADLAFARTELPECVQMTQQGVARVAAIVAALKELSHPERARSEPVDVNHAVTAALVVTKHEYRYVADVETSLGDVPRVAGHTGELMQVVINLVVNAAHAIADVAARSKERGRIRVATSRSGDDVLITVDDTGGGIPPAIRERIFEPFFTTKGPGRGTGQGLALARGIVERHRGSISFESHGGVGTTFVVRLPAHSTRKLLEAA